MTCLTFSPVYQYLCTRPQDHPGSHIAFGPYNRICAVWDDHDQRERRPARRLHLHTSPSPALSPPRNPPLRIVGKQASDPLHGRPQ